MWSFANLSLFCQLPFHFLCSLPVLKSNEQREIDDDVKDLLNRSITELENQTTTQSHDEYEVVNHVPKLPERKNFPRSLPITAEQWRTLQDHEGRIEDVESVKLVIFRGVSTAVIVF